MEETLEVRFFERSREGLRLTTAGEMAFHEAQKLASEMENLERRLRQEESAPEGRVRIAAPDTLMTELLAPVLAVLLLKYPDIELEMLTDNDVSNLTHREADLTLRPENKPQVTWEGERIAAIEYAVYATPGYCRRNRGFDIDQRPEQLRWIIPDETFSQLATGRWYQKHLKNVTSVIRCNSVQAMVALARSGAGAAVLPCYVGEEARELRRLSEPLEGESVDLWLHVNQDTQQMARVRLVMAFLVNRLRALETSLEFSTSY